MNAVLTKPLKRGIKTIYGQVLCRGIGRITLLVQGKGGLSSIKTFKENDYIVNIY